MIGPIPGDISGHLSSIISNAIGDGIGRNVADNIWNNNSEIRAKLEADGTTQEVFQDYMKSRWRGISSQMNEIIKSFSEEEDKEAEEI